MTELDFYSKYRTVSPQERKLKDGGIMKNGGITVREYMATHILNGLLCREDTSNHTFEECVDAAIKAADMLQKKLSDESSMDYRKMRGNV